MNLHEALKRVLVEIENGHSRAYGICYWVTEYMELPSIEDHVHFFSSINAIFLRWGFFSGILGFPVPAPDGSDPFEIYFNSPDSMYTGPYGEKRIELLKFMIEETKT
jgi:hypothetical protein